MGWGQLFDEGAPGNCTREWPVSSMADPELFSCLVGGGREALTNSYLSELSSGVGEGCWQPERQIASQQLLLCPGVGIVVWSGRQHQVWWPVCFTFNGAGHPATADLSFPKRTLIKFDLSDL